MFIFSYATGWADLMVDQLASARGSDNPFIWGYACLCIGREFDAVITENYDEINEITGETLNVFSMLPPPVGLLDERLQQMRRGGPDSGSYERLLKLRDSNHAYSDDPNRRADNKRIQIREKVALLKELEGAGLRANQYADFLFFDFRRQDIDDIEIDVIAAKQSPLNPRSSPQDYLEFFRRMAETSERHYQQGDSVEQFVRALSLEWSARISIGLTDQLWTFLDYFVKAQKRISHTTFMDLEQHGRKLVTADQSAHVAEVDYVPRPSRLSLVQERIHALPVSPFVRYIRRYTWSVWCSAISFGC